MGITEEIMVASQGLLTAYPEVSAPESGYRMFNDGGVEVEVGEFLYGMTRLLKPTHVLETGTHKGISAAYIGAALRDNQRSGGPDGLLTTVEWEQRHFHDAWQLVSNIGLASHVSIANQDARTFRLDFIYELMFLDSEPQLRFDELIRFFPNLADGGYAIIHDLHANMHQVENENGFAWPYGRIPFELMQLVRTGQLRVVHFENPRGMTAFYKPHADSYVW